MFWLNILSQISVYRMEHDADDDDDEISSNGTTITYIYLKSQWRILLLYITV